MDNFIALIFHCLPFTVTTAVELFLPINDFLSLAVTFWNSTERIAFVFPVCDAGLARPGMISVGQCLRLIFCAIHSFFHSYHWHV